jgi:hypothetical protein
VGNGLQTAAITYGGYNWGTSTTLNVTESYNGTSWTNVNSLNTARYAHGGSGTQTAAITYGGSPGNITTTELWNGTSWTANPTGLATGRSAATKQIGTQTAALAVGGSAGGPNLNITESWNTTALRVRTITVS